MQEEKLHYLSHRYVGSYEFIFIILEKKKFESFFC